ncbi:MAG: hypothetical protein ACI9NC_006053 [Verrucomicrobiales bacterium]
MLRHTPKKSLCGLALAGALLGSASAAETQAAASASIGAGLLAQLLFLPAGLLIAAVLLEFFARKKSSASLHRGVLAILLAAGLCSIAALSIAFTSPEKAASLSGSPFIAFNTGAAFAGIILLTCLTKWLRLKVPDSSAITPKPKPKTRGRGRGRRRAAGSPAGLATLAEAGYTLSIAAAVAALIAAPMFAKPSPHTPAVTTASPSSDQPPPELEQPELPSKPLDQEPTHPQVIATAEPDTPKPDAEPEVVDTADSPEVGSPTAKPDLVAEVSTQPEPMTEQPTVPEEPVTPTVEEPPPVGTLRKPAVRPVSIQRGGLAGVETFNKLVEPILRDRCYSCHDADKQKGDLRLDSPEAIRKGGKSGPIIIAGNIKKSYLHELISLDASDDDIMPPKGKPLTGAQIAWIGGWIREGAAMGDGVAWPVPEGGNDTGLAIDKMTDGVGSTDESAVQALLDGGVIVRKLSSDGKLLEIDFSHSDLTAGDQRLANLASLAENVHSLDLNRTKITDDDLKILSGMSNLRILHLQRTKITDAALPHLSGLGQLESLNLYNTKVSDAGLPELKKLTSLQKIYLWSTQVTPDGARELASVLGSDVVNMGE